MLRSLLRKSPICRMSLTSERDPAPQYSALYHRTPVVGLYTPVVGLYSASPVVGLLYSGVSLTCEANSANRALSQKRRQHLRSVSHGHPQYMMNRPPTVPGLFCNRALILSTIFARLFYKRNPTFQGPVLVGSSLLKSGLFCKRAVQK